MSKLIVCQTGDRCRYQWRSKPVKITRSEYIHRFQQDTLFAIQRGVASSIRIQVRFVQASPISACMPISAWKQRAGLEVAYTSSKVWFYALVCWTSPCICVLLDECIDAKSAAETSSYAFSCAVRKFEKQSWSPRRQLLIVVQWNGPYLRFVCAIVALWDSELIGKVAEAMQWTFMVSSFYRQ